MYSDKVLKLWQSFKKKSNNQMQYTLSSANPASRFMEIECKIHDVQTPTIELQLPAWRPGRYELQHFAKNIQKFEVYDSDNKLLKSKKITKDRWLVQTEGATDIVARYRYYANVQDAGGSFVSDSFWYVNPVNLCIYADSKRNEPCTLKLNLPDHFQIACGLADYKSVINQGERLLLAKDYYELVDSPLLASATLQCQSYEIGQTQFFVWFQGNYQPNWERILLDFGAFSRVQIEMMGEFPEAQYHFLNLILPTAFYHGVEHRHSTMIVLGPDDEGDGLYADLLGVSSHELFHAWNIIRIRPKELLPYDLTKENYFETCFVAEGVTTYYGDLFLKRANVFDESNYLRELEVILKQHFENARYASLSLVQSSWDLWLDGYSKGIPDRKVSVYHKGAIVALILDLTIRQKHQHQRSLDTVMRQLWHDFGKPFVGYGFDDYKKVVETVMGEPLDWYWEECIVGNVPLESRLNEILTWVGLTMQTSESGFVQLEVFEIENFERLKWLEN
jgi:predicted metalloprotease with PDZ domain